MKLVVVRGWLGREVSAPRRDTRVSWEDAETLLKYTVLSHFSGV